MPIKTRILANIEIDDNGCWRWMRYKLPNGYGMIGTKHATKAYVHRVAYEAWKGPIPEGLVIDHLCRVRDCCNPEHLEPVTYSQNTLRGDTIMVRRANATACFRGHEYTPENTKPDRSGVRRCRTCYREAQRRIYWRTERAKRMARKADAKGG